MVLKRFIKLGFWILLTIISSDCYVARSIGPIQALGPLYVYPGAQGFGRETVAGRGGQVIKVTSLNDSGPGTLREALQYTSGPRIIVFEMGGEIHLKSTLTVSNPYVTIAGQTAPFPGTHTTGYGFKISTHDVLMQHLFVRYTATEVRDAIDVHRDPVPYNIVIDHVSAAWGRDECLSFAPGGTNTIENNVTYSNNIIAESGYGTLISSGTKNFSAIGNLWISNRERQPRVNGGASANLVNNVSYNIGNAYSTVVGSAVGPSYLTAVGNVYINGPNTTSTSYGISIYDDTAAGTQIYIADAMATSNVYSSKTAPYMVSTPPVSLEGIFVQNSNQVENSVFANAGARPGERDGIIGNGVGDDVDERLVMEVETRTGSLKSSAPSVPDLEPAYRSFSVPANPSGDDNGDGYTNIEEILYSMALEVEGEI